MKKIFLFSVLCAVVTLLTSCSKDSGGEATKPSKLIVGQWHMTSWAGSAEAMDIVDVYIEFESGKFTIYQKVQYPYYIVYSGTYLIDKDLLSGVYSDGKNWGSEYTVAFKKDKITDNDIMTMTSTVNQDDVVVYERMSIPSDVLDANAMGTTSRGEAFFDIRRFL